MKKINLSIAAALFVAANSYAQELGTITVSSATKSEQSIQDVTSNVEIITSVELEEKNIKTVTEALNLVSGISFTSNGGLGKQSSVYLRGMSSSRTLVLIDGVRYNDITGISGARFENLMINNIKQIEVIKGAQSGIWGADASAGVINIITKKPKDGLSGTLGVEYGSFDTKKYNALASYKTDKYYLQANHQKLTTNGFTSYAKKSENIDKYEDDGYENKTTDIKLGVNITDNSKVDLSHTIIDAYNEYDDSSADNPNKYSESKTKISSVAFENKSSIATTHLYFNKSDFFRDNVSDGNYFDGNIKETGIKSKIDYLDETSFFIVGADYKKFEQKDDTKEEYDNKALFLTNSNRFDNLILTESIRFDNYDAFENKTTGKIGVKYSFNDGIEVFSNYGTAYSSPTLYQLYAPGFTSPWNGQFYPVGNKDLKPETTQSMDIGFSYEELKITYFENKIKDMIDYKNGYENLMGTSTIEGLEVEYIKEVIEDFVFSLNYSKLKTKDNKGYKLERRAEETLKFGVDYYGVDKLHLGLNGEYIGDRIEYAYGTYDIDATTGNYTIANLVANYDLTKDIKIYGKIDNITDKYYQTVDGYATSPRAYYAGIKYNF